MTFNSEIRFKASHVKSVEARPTLSETKTQLRTQTLPTHDVWRYSQRFLRNKA